MKKVIWSLAALSVLGCGGFLGTKKSKSNQPVVAASPVPTVNALPVTDASPAPTPEPTVVGTSGPTPEVTVAPTPEVTVAPTAAPVPVPQPTVVGPDLPPAPVGLVYADVKQIIDTNCQNCHAFPPRKNLGTLDLIKPLKSSSLRRINSGNMPRDWASIPAFKETDDGRELIKWLNFGSDLQ